MKYYLKYIFQGFKSNISRFIAVIAIVALGVGMLVGLLSAPDDLHQAIDKNYDQKQVMDLNIKSTIGFFEETIEVIKKYDAFVEGIFIEEDSVKIKNVNRTSRMISYDVKNSKINQLSLKKGTYPENKNECLALYDNKIYEKLDIGDTFIYKNEEYKVVGIVESPVYYYNEKEYNLTATSKLDFIFYVDYNLQKHSAITDLWVYYPKLKSYNSFDKEYYLELNKSIETLENIKLNELEKQKNVMYEIIYNEVKEKIRVELINHHIPDERIEDLITQELNKEETKQRIEDQLNAILEENGYDWIFLDKEDTMSHITFKQNVDKINKIAIVFPVFFYFIAALVSLTTITRLVEEERTSIGLLKSLGFSKGKISFKYILYGIICSIIGAISGATLGIFVLPYVIHIAFQTLYLMPNCVFTFNIFVNLISSLFMILTIVSVALYVSLKCLKERPCTLLLPKAPKPGKRILLERIPFLWKKIKFKYKNALRNIFRYKKNLIMMMIGVGGCVSLLLCAFGIENAISSVGKKQYEEIFKYDLKVNIQSGTQIESNEIEGIKESINIYLEDTNLIDNKEYDITKIVTSNDLNEYIHFISLKDKNLVLQPNDVFITEQLAKKLNLKKKDILRFKNDDKEYKVTGICKNYIGNYVYIYDESNTLCNSCFIKIEEDKEEAIVDSLSILSNVKSIEVKSQTASSYNNMSDSIILIVIVIILCSGALAIIVIYNLTNININERIKEIATLKVLSSLKP